MSDMYDDCTDVMDRDEIDIEEPKDCAVIFLNDNYTGMDFVVQILREIFHKTAEESEKIMIQVHTKGEAEAYRGPYDICITRQSMTQKLAKQYGFPFKTEVREC